VVLQQDEAALARIAQAAQPNGTPQLGEVHPVRRPLLSVNQNYTPAALPPLRRQNPREEPGALAAHAGICAGGEEKPITAKERPRGENVVDLMDALRKSIGGEAARAEPSKKPTKKPKKATPGQKEMLMPIAGKKPAREAATKKPAAKPQRKSA